MKKYFKNKGFTLIELLLFMAMFSVILIVLSSLFSSIVEKQLETESVSAVEHDSKYITARMLYDISRADSITTPATLGSQTSNLSIIISGITYSYGLLNGNLTLNQGVQTDNLNSEGSIISGLSFTRLGNTTGKHAIQVAFTITSRTVLPSGPETKTINTIIGLR